MPPSHTLTLFRTAKIQRYIFGSNRLREHIGASDLVEQCATAWLAEELNACGITNVEITKQTAQKLAVGLKFNSKTMEKDRLDAELLAYGGGNASILFSTPELARDWARRLTERILRRVPGLRVAIAHQDFVWNPDGVDLRDVIGQARAGFATNAPLAAAPLLGLGVTAACGSTGMVAVTTSDVCGSPDRYPASSEIAAKLRCTTSANERLRLRLPLKNDFSFPFDFDDFGRSHGEQSYIAVVHADGNGMGQRLRDYANAGSPTNREYVMRLREWSDSVREASDESLRSLVGRIEAMVPDGDNRLHSHEKIARSFELIYSNASHKYFLPFRPLIAGGDDVTFVCDGRLGLDLATAYLEELGRHTLLDGQPALACAGVAIVKTHYPFARAYDLAEELCASAKQYLRTHPELPQAQALDWHIAASGLSGSLADIRLREYTANGQPLQIRPVLAGENTGQASWTRVAALAQSLRDDERWRDSRNKVIRLFETLRAGPHAIAHFNKVYLAGKMQAADGLIAETIATIGEQTDLTAHCALFDAIEMLDFYWPLAATHPQEVAP